MHDDNILMVCPALFWDYIKPREKEKVKSCAALWALQDFAGLSGGAEGLLKNNIITHCNQKIYSTGITKNDNMNDNKKRGLPWSLMEYLCCSVPYTGAEYHQQHSVNIRLYENADKRYQQKCQQKSFWGFLGQPWHSACLPLRGVLGKFFFGGQGDLPCQSPAWPQRVGWLSWIVPRVNHLPMVAKRDRSERKMPQ